MKKRFQFLPLLLFFSSLSALAQTSVPVVPVELTFADISVHLDPDARQIVQKDVNALLANRQYWMAKLDRVVLYFPLIEAIFIEEDIPTDFKYLAVQESSLTPDAVSSSTAVGYWQFKRETAMDNGMRVDDEVDERKSITASTRGAAKYLKRSNAQFNNWIASLFSYYLGAGGIAKLIPPDWSYAREVALDGRTDRYILRFFAHKIAIENALQTHQTSNNFALVEYPNGGGKSMRAIAEELDVDEFELRKYNRWVLGNTVPTDKPYILAIPVASNQINDVRQKIGLANPSKTPDFIQTDVGFPVLRRVTTGLSSKNEPVLYEINGLPGIQAQLGDNAASLARKAKISLSSFLRYNDMSDRDPILLNNIYYLAKKRKKALVPFHTVREDETARSISQRYGIRLKSLMRYNRLDRIQKLVTGRVMWLRERRPANKPVEVISAPTPPVYDQTPTPMNRPDVAASTPARPVSGSDGIPRTPSERKLYQPKLLDGGVTPNDGTSEPASAPRPEPTRPAAQPTVTRSIPATPGGIGGSDGSQRVVIVRTPEATQPVKTVPVATTPERVKPDSNAAVTLSKPAKLPDAVAAKPRPASASDSDMGIPEKSKYEGPSEQQADGSITSSARVPVTKAPPRPAATPTPRTETRPIDPAPVAKASEVKPASSPAPVASRPATTPAGAPNQLATTHTVEAGQTYYSISKQYDLSVEELLALNKLTTDDVLEVGQKLIVKPTPGGRIIHPSATEKPASTPPAKATYHTVVKGETMYRISQQYGISIEEILTWNDLHDVGVRIGQKIRVSKP